MNPFHTFLRADYRVGAGSSTAGADGSPAIIALGADDAHSAVDAVGRRMLAIAVSIALGLTATACLPPTPTPSHDGRQPEHQAPASRATRASEMRARTGPTEAVQRQTDLTPTEDQPAAEIAGAPPTALEARVNPEDSITVPETRVRPQGEHWTSEWSGPDEQPRPFRGREEVSYGEFVAALRALADQLATDDDVVAAHARLLEKTELTRQELPLESFSRVRLVFESARAHGLWQIRYAITDRMPWSDAIWSQWRAGNARGRQAAPLVDVSLTQPDGAPEVYAECDELSALFAILVRDLGVVGFVGLHWPYWNHVVSVWQVPRRDESFVRIVVPTTQVFLKHEETLGTTTLPTRRVIFPYVRQDLTYGDTLPGPLVRFLLERSATFGGLSTAELDERRRQERLRPSDG